MQKFLDEKYMLVQEEIVMLIEHIQFLYLESLYGVYGIETKNDWGNTTRTPENISKTITGIVRNFKKPATQSYHTLINNLWDNKQCSLEFVSGNCEQYFPTDNFAFGSCIGINCMLGTEFIDEDDLNGAINAIYQDIYAQYCMNLGNTQNTAAGMIPDARAVIDLSTVSTSIVQLNIQDESIVDLETVNENTIDAICCL